MKNHGIVVCGFCNQVFEDMKSTLAHMYTYHQEISTNLCMNCGQHNMALVHVAASCTTCIHKAGLPMLQIPLMEANQTVSQLSEFHAATNVTGEEQPSPTGTSQCNPFVGHSCRSIWGEDGPFDQEPSTSGTVRELGQSQGATTNNFTTPEDGEVGEPSPRSEVTPEFSRPGEECSTESLGFGQATVGEQQEEDVIWERSNIMSPTVTWDEEAKILEKVAKEKRKDKKLKKKSSGVSKNTENRTRSRGRITPSPIECSICSTSVQLEGLWLHMRRRHNHHAIQCYLCDVTVQQGYIRHLIRNHPEVVSDDTLVQEDLGTV